MGGAGAWAGVEATTAAIEADQILVLRIPAGSGPEAMAHYTDMAGELLAGIQEQRGIDPLIVLLPPGASLEPTRERLLENIRRLYGVLGATEKACDACGVMMWMVPTRHGKRAPYTAQGASHMSDCPQARRFKKDPKDYRKGDKGQ